MKAIIYLFMLLLLMGCGTLEIGIEQATKVRNDATISPEVSKASTITAEITNTPIRKAQSATATPTIKPTLKPTIKPTLKPTVSPTSQPEPTISPTSQPEASITPEPTIDGGLRLLVASIQQELTERDYDALQALMAERFIVGYWLSGWQVQPSEEAILQLQEYFFSDTTITFTSDETKWQETFERMKQLLGSQNEVVDMFHSVGWGNNGKGEIIFFVTRNEDEQNQWESFLYSPRGFGIREEPVSQFPVLWTQIEGVMVVAEQEAILYAGPSEQYGEVDRMASGLPIAVNGISEDGKWYHTYCPDAPDPINCNYWVSADPTVTEPLDVLPQHGGRGRPYEGDGFILTYPDDWKVATLDHFALFVKDNIQLTIAHKDVGDETSLQALALPAGELIDVVPFAIFSESILRRAIVDDGKVKTILYDEVTVENKVFTFRIDGMGPTYDVVNIKPDIRTEIEEMLQTIIVTNEGINRAENDPTASTPP